jgi:tRNA (adenine-N(1)-)-methyltransferase non-catalytic subunit
MSVFPPPPEALDIGTRSLTIQSGDNILLRLPNGDTKAIKIEKNSCVPFVFFCFHVLIFLSTVSLGKLGGFHANELIDEPYGRTYDIVDKKLKLVPPCSLEELGRPFQHEAGSMLISTRGHGCYQRTDKRW